MKKYLMIILILISTLSLFSVINKINEYTTNGFSHSLYIDNEKAFIADGSKLLILDIADPVNIIECSDFQLPVVSSWIVDVFVENNIAYVVDRHNGLFIVDVSNTSNPQLIGEYLCSNLLKVIKHENIVILKFFMIIPLI